MSRRANQCHRDGCDSQSVWQMFVRFTTRTPGGAFVPCAAETTIKVCDAHRNAAAEGFVSEGNLDRLAVQFKRENLAVPGPGSIAIEFGRIKRDASVLELQTTTAPAAIVSCDRSGCVMPAQTQIALKLWSIGQSKRGQPLELLTGLCVCNRHRNETTAKNLLTPEAKSKLLGQLTENGVPMPDFRSAELAFVALVDGRKADPARFQAVGV